MTASRDFYGMVLSAGLGTRLAPLTDEIPKPLVPIGPTPLLGISLHSLAEAGACGLVVNVHHHAEKIESYVEGLGLGVQVSHEVEILGTGGGIARARPHFSGLPVVIINGDIVGKLPIQALAEVGGEGLVLALTPTPVGEGTVGLGEEGQVVRLRGETFGREVAAGDYMGVAWLGGACLAGLPEQGCLVGDWALPHLRDGGTIATVLVEHEFEDVGTPRDYLSANLNWLSRQGGGPTVSFLGPGARVDEDVKVVASVIGEGASISGTGTVVASLILPGARARAPLSNAIVTPSGTVIQAGEARGEGR